MLPSLLADSVNKTIEHVIDGIKFGLSSNQVCGSQRMPFKTTKSIMFSEFAKRGGSWALTRFLGIALLLQGGWLSADPIQVRYTEGSVHGFLALRTMEGKLVAQGDLVQVTRGDRVTSQLVFHFKDGSVDSDTAVFSQRLHFSLISDHHIQKGPAFPHPTDVTINAPKEQVTVRFKDKGKEKVESSHIDLPADLANGIILDVLKNISPETKETELSYLAATPKPRLVKLLISPQGQETFSVAGVRQRAMRFAVKVELGGLAGLFAPLVGKEPADTSVWIAGGKAPAFVRSDGPSYLGGPIWSIQMTSPDWGHSQRAGR